MMKEPYFEVKAENDELVFSIEANGEVKFLTDGKLKTVKSEKDLALAFAGAINAVIYWCNKCCNCRRGKT